MQLASAQASSVRLCLVERCVDFMTSPSQGRSMWNICQRDLFVVAVIVVSTCPGRSAGGGHACLPPCLLHAGIAHHQLRDQRRSEEHTSELQSLMRISYPVFCLKKKKITTK